jgi:hypothetical protein
LKTPALLFACLLLLTASAAFPRQNKKRAVWCKSSAFAALKPLPKLEYPCPSDIADDYDDRILKTPERIAAIKQLRKELESFKSAEWWNAPVDDLNACYLSDKTGQLTEEQQEQFYSFEYQPLLMGNNRFRLVMAYDPCYQTSYNGSTGFILYRTPQKTYVTQVLEGYYSRLGRSVFLRLLPASAIEIKTVNITAMQPDNTYHRFTIDRVSHKAVPARHARLK